MQSLPAEAMPTEGWAPDDTTEVGRTGCHPPALQLSLPCCGLYNSLAASSAIDQAAKLHGNGITDLTAVGASTYREARVVH